MKGERVHHQNKNNKRTHTQRDRNELTARRGQDPPHRPPLPSTSSTTPGRKKARSPHPEVDDPTNHVELPHDPSDAGAGIWSMNDPRLRAVASPPSPSPAGNEHEDATLLPQSRPSPPKENLPSSNSHAVVFLPAGLYRGRRTRAGRGIRRSAATKSRPRRRRRGSALTSTKPPTPSPPPRRRRREPTTTYTMYKPGSGDPPPSRRRSGRRRGGIPRTTGERGGRGRSSQKSPLDLL